MRPRPALWLAKWGADEIIGEDPGETGLRRLPRRRRQRELRLAAWPCLLLRRRAAGCRSTCRAAARRRFRRHRGRRLQDARQRSFEALNRFRCLPAEEDGHAAVLRGRQPAGACDAGRRGAGQGRGHPGQALRGQVRPVARPHAGGNRPVADGAGRESAVFITNAIFWRPPGNRTPTEAERNADVPALPAAHDRDPEARRHRVPRRHAPPRASRAEATAFLKLRAKWVTANVSGRNIPLLPTLHPAYLLRQPNQKRLAWRDLLSLRQMLVRSLGQSRHEARARHTWMICFATASTPDMHRVRTICRAAD